MQIKQFSIFGRGSLAISIMACFMFVFLFAGSASANSVSGRVQTGSTAVTDVTVYLVDCNTNQIVGSCHTDANGYYTITTSTSNPCKEIAVPDNSDASYVPTYYPNEIDAVRGYVIYPSDMPENANIEPVTEGELASTGTLVNISGNINAVSISGIPAFVFVMNGDRVISCHTVNANGSFSFVERMNANSSLKVTNIGFNTVNINFSTANVASEDNVNWNVSVNMVLSGNGSVVTPSGQERVTLNQNFPNPFNPTTNISFKVPSSGLVKVLVYDLSGRMISQLVNEYRAAGSYSVTFNASNLSSGIYYYSIENGNSKITKQMMLIK
ncbi:hypothetical protein BH10BAC5_BH10BAC5_10450 [soil metagenome]